uniref:SIS domain-containing protein n=1 Tax=Syphacia muris TaxID=451379 RepID=A0A0N5ADF6_9BILA
MSSSKLREQLKVLTTEAINPAFNLIDCMTTIEIAELMNSEDAKVPSAIKQVLPEIAASVDSITNRMEKGGRLIYAGSGTAGRIGVLDAVECVPTFNTPVGEVVGIIAGGEGAMMLAVEGAEDNATLAENDLKKINLSALDAVVGISASGRTPFAIGAMKYAKNIGALTVGLACNRNSELCANADHRIEVIVGPEIVAGSTRLKAGTAQKLVCNMLSTLTMIKLGKTYGNLMVNLRATNQKLIARSYLIVKEATGASEEEVARALDTFDGDVKCAVVAILSGNHQDAKRALVKAKGRIRDALMMLRRNTSEQK